MYFLIRGSESTRPPPLKLFIMVAHLRRTPSAKCLSRLWAQVLSLMKLQVNRPAVLGVSSCHYPVRFQGLRQLRQELLTGSSIIVTHYPTWSQSREALLADPRASALPATIRIHGGKETPRRAWISISSIPGRKSRFLHLRQSVKGFTGKL